MRAAAVLAAVAASASIAEGAQADRRYDHDVNPHYPNYDRYPQNRHSSQQGQQTPYSRRSWGGPTYVLIDVETVGSDGETVVRSGVGMYGDFGSEVNFREGGGLSGSLVDAGGGEDLNDALASLDVEFVRVNPPDGCRTGNMGNILSWVQLRNRFAVALRGNCTYVEKALNAQSHGALGLIVLDGSGVLSTMSSGGTPAGEQIRIPVLKVSKDWWPEGQNHVLQGQIKSYTTPTYDPARLVMAVVAIAIVIAGAYWSAFGFYHKFGATRTLRYRQRYHHRRATTGVMSSNEANENETGNEDKTSPTNRNEDEDDHSGRHLRPSNPVMHYSSEQETSYLTRYTAYSSMDPPVALKESYAWGFIVVAAILIIVLFKFIYVIEYVLLSVFCVAGALGMYTITTSVAEAIFCGQREHEDSEIDKFVSATIGNKDRCIDSMDDLKRESETQDHASDFKFMTASMGTDNKFVTSSTASSSPLPFSITLTLSNLCLNCTYIRAFCAILCTTVALYGAVTRATNKYIWIVHDLLGISFLLMLQRIVYLPTVKGSTILLSMAFVYNLFLIFFSAPHHFEESIIAQATKAGLGQNATPMLLRIPYFNEPFGGLHYAVFGLGEIGIPGLYISNLLQIDLKRQLWIPGWKFLRQRLRQKNHKQLRKLFSEASVHASNESNTGTQESNESEDPRQNPYKPLVRNNGVGYFVAGTVGFTVGTVLTELLEVVYQRAQPALVYIVPCVFLPVATLAYYRDDLMALWDEDYELESGEPMLQATYSYCSDNFDPEDRKSIHTSHQHSHQRNVPIHKNDITKIRPSQHRGYQAGDLQ